MLALKPQKLSLFFVLLSIGMLAHLQRALAKDVAPNATAKTSSTATVDSDDSDDDDSDADDSDDDDDDSTDPSDLAEQGKALSGNVTLASDYIFRGLSQTEHNPAIQGGFDWEHPLGFYLGVWGSNVHFDGLPESLELDGYGGYTYAFTEKSSLSLGALYYSYWADGDRNSWIYSLTGKWRGFSLESDYSPNWEGQNTGSWYFQGGWQGPVIREVKLGALIGYSVFGNTSEDPDYADYLIFASREFLSVEWKLSGVFVNTQVINNAEGGDRAIFSVTKSL